MKKILLILIFVIIITIAVVCFCGCSSIKFEQFVAGLSLREYFEKNKDSLSLIDEYRVIWADEEKIASKEERLSSMPKVVEKQGEVHIKEMLQIKGTSGSTIFELEEESEKYIDDVVGDVFKRVPDTDLLYTDWVNNIGMIRGLGTIKYGIVHGAMTDGKSIFTKDGKTLLGLENNENVKNYSVPTHIETIGPFAFNYCKALEQVYMLDNVVEIDDYAFCDNDSTFPLYSVRLSKNLKRIGDGAFSCCCALKSLTLPDGLESIGDNAFLYTISTINIPISVKEIGRYALNGLIIDNLSNLSKMGPYALSNCTLNFSEFPGKISKISNCAFSYATFTAIKDLILPETVTEIDINAFVFVKGLDSVTLPQNITFISEDCFRASSIKSVQFSENIKRIEKYAYKDCLNLSAITLPKTIEYCEIDAFLGCTSLKTVTVETAAATSAEHFSLYENAETVYFANDIETHITQTEEFLARFILAESQDKTGYIKWSLIT